jgi:hypothetical protein
MDVFDVMSAQRACRSFDPDGVVDGDALDRILAAATRARSRPAVAHR